MRVLIVGCGASGLALATKLEENNVDYLILEKNDKVGRKILASGNGRANLSNLSLDDSFYKNASYFNYDKYSWQNFLKAEEFLTTTDEEGRMYPFSNSSLSLLNFLLSKINQNKIKLNSELRDIKRNNLNKFIYDNQVFDKLVLACGSIINNNSEHYFDIFNNLKIELSQLGPSLVGFKINNINKRLEGIRVPVLATLSQDNQIIHSEEGEMIFKKNGISGIVIMNMSFYYNRLVNKNNVSLEIKMYPKLDNEMITKYYKANKLEFLLNPKLYDVIKTYSLEDTLKFIQHFKITNLNLYDFSLAQVVSGGVKISEVNKNFSLKADKDIYVIGEALDVDAACGGYNLNFAFSSGLSLAKEFIK